MADHRLTEAAARVEAFAAAHLAREPVVGAAVALTAPDGAIAEFGYGFADRESRRAASSETVFPIASIGKAFTAVCVLNLAQEGALDLDDPVARHLPWLPLQGVTLRHLINHTSGLVSGMEISPSTEGEARTLLGIPRGAPGARFHYSNGAYGVLGLVVAAAAGCSYPQAVERYVLEPLEMTRSSALTTQEMQLTSATGYRPLVEFAETRELVAAPWVATDSGAGCACCTAGDLARFVRMLLDGGGGPRGMVVSESNLELMKTPGVGGAGYGHGLKFAELDGARMIGHSGDAPGFQSHMWGDPRTGMGVVVLWSGPGSTWAIVEHGLALLAAAQERRPLPLAPEPGPDAAPDPGPLVDHPYAGTYRAHNPWLPGIRIVAREAGLGLVYHDGFEDPLTELEDGDYRVGEEGVPERARFLDEVDGRPLGVWFSGQRFDRTPW